MISFFTTENFSTKHTTMRQVDSDIDVVPKRVIALLFENFVRLIDGP